VKFPPGVPKCLPTLLEIISCLKSSLMTAKKKATSSSKTKTAKPKPAKAKAVAKKATKPIAVKKTSSVKKTSVKKTATQTTKAKAIPKASVKKPTKQVVKKATPSKKSKVTVKKRLPPIKDSSTISKVKEIVSKTLGKSTSEESKAESTAFSFDDVLSFLKSKKKPGAKKKAVKESAEKKVTKAEKVKEKKSSKVKKLTTASIDDILGFGGPSVAVGRPLWDESKVPKQWMPYFRALMSLRSALKGSLGERSSETIGASARESGELSINSSDAGTETFDRDLALSMVANDQEALEEIEDAIDRIFNGTYGVCLETKKPINKNRLKAVPFTRFSVEGQIQFERGKIKERDFGSGSFATLADSTMGEEE